MSTKNTLNVGYGAGGYGEDGYGSPFSDELALKATTAVQDSATEAQLSLWATALDQITVTDIWTDWVVADSQTAGGVSTDTTEEAGTISLDWTEIATDVEPTFTFALPDRYVGGEYALVVSGSDGTESVTQTVTIDLGG